MIHVMRSDDLCHRISIKNLLHSTYYIKSMLQQEKLHEFYLHHLQPGKALPDARNIKDGFLEDLYSLIERNLDNYPLNVKFLCLNMCLSKNTLNRKLPAIAGLFHRMPQKFFIG
jgi:hypothetical protein